MRSRMAPLTLPRMLVDGCNSCPAQPRRERTQQVRRMETQPRNRGWFPLSQFPLGESIEGRRKAASATAPAKAVHELSRADVLRLNLAYGKSTLSPRRNK